MDLKSLKSVDKELIIHYTNVTMDLKSIERGYVYELHKRRIRIY